MERKHSRMKQSDTDHHVPNRTDDSGAKDGPDSHNSGPATNSGDQTAQAAPSLGRTTPLIDLTRDVGNCGTRLPQTVALILS